mmetsp:Transcript_8625/g.12729  ORF Transcript_8625/g.12729 Transcript_8625/m.12729 type:complete len:155 (+) Transcript_8625:66-530(+)
MVSFKEGDSIKNVWEDISGNKSESETNWLALGYCGKEELEMIGSGTGGYAEFIKTLNDDDVVFAGFRIYGLDEDGERSRTKLVSVTYVPKNVKGLKKARVGPQRGQVLKQFHGAHVDMEVGSAEELSKEAIIAKLANATGSHKPVGYDGWGDEE